MPRGLRKKTKQYVLDRFQEEDPEGFFKYMTKSTHGLTQDQLDFIQAVECQSIQKIRLMLNSGVDPNFFHPRNGRQTPLHLAVRYKNGPDNTSEKIIGVLLFFGADPCAEDGEGRSPLHTACVCGNSTAVKLLLNAGADVNQLDNCHETPLLCAGRKLCEESTSIFDLLLSSGADVTCINDENQSVLHKLTAYQLLHNFEKTYEVTDRHTLVEKCLTHGVSANMVDDRGLSPLCYELVHLFEMQVVETAMLDTFRVLLCGGAVLQKPFDIEEIEYVLKRSSVAYQVHAVSVLCLLIKCFHTIMPQEQCHLLMEQIQKIHHLRSSNLTEKQQREVEALLITVPSLAHYCRLSVKKALGGLVYHNVKHLPIPDKMKNFICS